MKLMQCDKKHFYDGEKFSVCPYCTGATGNLAFMQGANINMDLKLSMTEEPEQYVPTEILDEINLLN